MVFGGNRRIRLPAILVVEEEQKEPKNWSFSQPLDVYSVLVVHNLIFRLDRNLLLLSPGTIHTFSGSHPPQPTYLRLSYSSGLC